MKHIKNKGVYIIVNTITFDFYIGSSHNIKNRLSRHLRELKKGTHHSTILQRAVNKYHINNFKFASFIQEDDSLLELEQLCIDFLNPKYNVSKYANAPMKGRKHIEKTKKIMSKAHTGNKYNLNKKRTLEQKRKRSEARRGYKHSENTRKKMSLTAKKINSINRIPKDLNKRPIVDNIGNQFNSITEASVFYKKSKATIIDILKGRHLQTKEGISFKYL